MGKKRQRWCSWLDDALAHPHNSSLTSTQEGSTTVHVLRCGARELQLVRSNAKEQVLWRQHRACDSRHVSRILWCSHFKLCTADALRDINHLSCTLCTPDAALGRAGRRVAVGGAQLELMKAVDAKHLPHTWVWETRCLPNWQGCIDLYFLASRLMVQVDGRHHFSGNAWEEPLLAQMRADMQCNAAAWEHGARLLRLSDHDATCSGLGLLDYAMCLAQHASTGPLLVLSSTFYSLHCSELWGNDSYAQHIAKQLNARFIIGKCKCVVLTK